MSEQHPAEHRDELPGEGVVRGAVRLVGGLIADELANGAVFFSLLLVAAAVITMDPPYVALGAVVGIAGMVVPWRGMRSHWTDSTMLLVAIGVLVLDAAAVWVLWQHGGLDRL